MFTKTQAEIMKVFVANIGRQFSIKEIAENLNKPYPLIHRSMKWLLKEGYVIEAERKLISLNYKRNHAELVYIEALRINQVITKDKALALFNQDVQNKIGLDFFVLLVFGSYVEKSNPRDIDILVIIEDKGRLAEIEQALANIASQFTKRFEIQIVTTKSAYEMLGKRDNVNILNESLNKHLLLFGAENYYKMVTNAR